MHPPFCRRHLPKYCALLCHDRAMRRLAASARERVHVANPGAAGLFPPSPGCLRHKGLPTRYNLWFFRRVDRRPGDLPRPARAVVWRGIGRALQQSGDIGRLSDFAAKPIAGSRRSSIHPTHRNDSSFDSRSSICCATRSRPVNRALPAFAGFELCQGDCGASAFLCSGSVAVRRR